MMKVIVAGGRDFNDYDLLKSKLDYYLSNIREDLVIISGTCRGADQLGERYANENGYEILPVPAKWDELGKKAGFIRNVEMAALATHCIVFWDGESPGTKNMIDEATKKKLNLKIIKY